MGAKKLLAIGMAVKLDGLGFFEPTAEANRIKVFE